ncbi:MAG: hypothetical protein H7138_15870 [Myxococcales bacterium]|nr:hypothetical protein [Myxococcales bacterium]
MSAKVFVLVATAQLTCWIASAGRLAICVAVIQIGFVNAKREMFESGRIVRANART